MLICRAFLWVLIEDLGPHEDLFCEMVLIGASSPHSQFVQLVRHDLEESVYIFVMVLQQGTLHFLVRGAGGQNHNKVFNY